MIHQLGSALVVLAALLTLACAVFYGAFFRWWTSPIGRHLFRFTVVFAVALCLWAGLLLTSDTAWAPLDATPREWVRMLVLIPVDVVLAERLWFIAKAKRDEIRQRKEGR